MKPFFLLLAAGFPFLMQADETFGGYTNRAGHVLEGKPISEANGKVTFLLRSGAETSYPLRVFLPEERERIRAVLGIFRLPYPLATIFDHYREQIRRADAMERDNLLSPEKAEEKRRLSRSFWRAEVDRALAKKEISAVCAAQWRTAL